MSAPHGVRALERRTQAARRALEEAQVRLREVEAEEKAFRAGPIATGAAAAEGAYDAAQAAYLDKPTDANGERVLAARDRSTLARMQAQKAETLLEQRMAAAREAFDRATSEDAAAGQALEREKRVAALRARADQSALHDAVRPHWARVDAALEMLEQAATGIAAAFASARAASRELAELGVEDAPPLDEVHASVPMLEHELANGRTYAVSDHFLHRLFRHPVQGGMTLETILAVASGISAGRHQRQPLPEDVARHELSVFKATRTLEAARELRAELTRRRAPSRQEEAEPREEAAGGLPAEPDAPDLAPVAPPAA